MTKSGRGAPRAPVLGDSLPAGGCRPVPPAVRGGVRACTGPREGLALPGAQLQGGGLGAAAAEGFPINGDEQAVADLINKAHSENTSILKYNDENSLSCVISIAYYSAKRTYTVERELPAGKGYADLVFKPRRNNSNPAMIVELKYNKSAESAIQQIKDKNYPGCLKDYSGEVLLVGISYDDNKRHCCRIEKIVCQK